MSQTWYLILFAFSLFNFPIYSVGSNSVGIFDALILITFLYVSLTRLTYSRPPVFILIQLVIVMLISLSTLLNSYNYYISSNDFLYLFKLFSFSLIPILVLEFLGSQSCRYNFMKMELYLLITGFLLLIYSIYEAHQIYGMTRSGVPFSYGSSGPLGLVGLGFCFHFFLFDNAKRKFLFLTIGICLLFVSFSKSFILAFLALLIYRIRDIINFKFLTIIISIFLSGIFYVLDDLIFLYDSFDNFSEITTFAERLDNHWFEYWDIFFNDYSYLIGIGKQNIDIALDSAYFYLLYHIGLLGCFLLLILFIWLFRDDEISKLYIISLLISGIFLETMIVSPRGMEPMMLLLSYYYLKNKSLLKDGLN